MLQAYLHALKFVVVAMITSSTAWTRWAPVKMWHYYPLVRVLIEDAILSQTLMAIYLSSVFKITVFSQPNTYVFIVKFTAFDKPKSKTERTRLLAFTKRTQKFASSWTLTRRDTNRYGFKDFTFKGGGDGSADKGTYHQPWLKSDQSPGLTWWEVTTKSWKRSSTSAHTLWHMYTHTNTKLTYIHKQNKECKTKFYKILWSDSLFYIKFSVTRKSVI